MKKIIAWSTGGLFSLLALLLATPALANHAWGSYHWSRSASPLSLKLGDNVSASWDAHLATASTDWSTSLALDTAIVSGNTNAARGRSTPKNCIPTVGRVEVCSASYGATGWLGIASVWASGSHITQGSVKLNDTYFNSAKYNTPAWRRFVTCQEIGHTLGLDHQDESFNNANLGSCMDYTSDPSGTIGKQLGNEHPNAHDYDQLAAIYAHLDTTTSALSKASSAGANTVDIDTSDPSQWGRAVRTSFDGRRSLYERELRGGQKIFTFVIWAE